jgi:DNA-binding CsgD family transcriptional regulator
VADEQPLTIAQLEVVTYIANGLRTSEIAAITYRSKSSIDEMLGAARRRAGAKTIPHLVSLVIASGVLEWSEDGERVIKVEP